MPKKGKGKMAKAAPLPALPKRPPPKPCGTSRCIARLDHHDMAVTCIAVSEHVSAIQYIHICVHTETDRERHTHTQCVCV